MGFVVTREQAAALIARDPRNKDVLFPYLNGEDLNTNPDQAPSRWVINFFDWTEEKARTYPDCFEIVERLVKPERDKLDETKSLTNRNRKKNWWRYGSDAKTLYETISKADQVMVVPLVSKYISFEFSSTDIVFMHKLGVIVFNNLSLFSMLSSTLHNIWCWKYSSTLGAGTLNYSPTDCFETFPIPEHLINIPENELNKIGSMYYNFRKEVMEKIQLGLTKTYNQFHNPKLTSVENDMDEKLFEKLHGKETHTLKRHLESTLNTCSFNEACQLIFLLRKLHQQMDSAVLNVYGWNDISLRHDFYEVDYLPENDRVRFTIHPDARQEVLKRLLHLNHQIHEKERLFTFDKHTTVSKKTTSTDNQATLF